ncbi:MAG TPA: phosphotransferase [Acidimicrobiia bacterium]|nr:phosphotransferase [Acidimicrobiia bacterium]
MSDSPIDIHDAGAVATAVAGWLAQRFDDTVALADTPSTAGDGLDNVIHFARFTGGRLPDAWRGPLVLRIHRYPDRLALAQREAAVQGWCADLGYPAPRMVHVFGPGELCHLPLQVMERAPGVTMIDALKRSPWRAPMLVRRLAALHVQLHELPVDHWPDPDAPLLADRRLRSVRTWVDALDDPDLRAALRRAEPVALELDRAPRVANHGDFHPLNVLVDGDRVAVIDWTDAALGDRHGDVARTALLFRAAALAADNRLERIALARVGPVLGRMYLRAYQRSAPLDATRLRRWEALHALHGWAQIRSLHAGAFDEGGARADVPEAMADWLAQRFARAMAD